MNRFAHKYLFQFGEPKIITNTKGAAIRTIQTALYINIQVMLLFTRKCYIYKNKWLSGQDLGKIK